MTADDLEPTRLEAAKAAARNFVENQPGTVQIGVVAFSNGGLVVQPPTNDQTGRVGDYRQAHTAGGNFLGAGNLQCPKCPCRGSHIY
jgi:Ca-activated chloride channel homolog